MGTSVVVSISGRRINAWLTGGILVASWLLSLIPVRAESSPQVTRRSHIQPVGEMVRSRRRTDVPHPFGLRLSRAPEILRRQLALVHGEGLVVDAVTNGSPAARQGFLSHDVLVRLNDQLLVLPEQFGLLLEAAQPISEKQQGGKNSQVVTVFRDGKLLTIRLGKQPVVMNSKLTPLPTAAALLAAPLPPPLGTASQKEPHSSPLLRQPASAVHLAGGLTAEVEQMNEKVELLREDHDFTIRLVHGDEIVLVVETAQGQPVFHDRIDSPAQLTAVPKELRTRVKAMLELLETNTSSRPTTFR